MKKRVSRDNNLPLENIFTSTSSGSAFASEKVEPGCPVLEITDGKGNLTWRSRMHVLAVMVYPQDPEKQDELAVTHLSGAIRETAAIVAEIGDLDAEIDFHLRAGELIASYGGLEALERAPGVTALDKQIEEAGWRGYLAARVLLRIFQMYLQDEPVNVDAAAQEVAGWLRKTCNLKGVGGPQSRTTILKAWGEFQPAVHLWAAYLTVDQTEDEDSCLSFIQRGLSPQNILYCLGTAHYFREFAMRIVGERGRKAKRPILDPLTTWCLPQDCPIPLDFDLQLLPTEDETAPLVFVARRNSALLQKFLK
ncbi:MAG: hypothetical protein AB7G75_31670 [Candidatus Binatia bacterium]